MVVSDYCGEGQCTVLLALDISAAFDAVEHSTLLERARTVFGVSGGALDWMRSFVTGRAQFIAVGIRIRIRIRIFI